MECHHGDPVATASRQFALLLEEDVRLAEVFLQAYASQMPNEPNLSKRLQRGLIHDRLLNWDYFTRPEHNSLPTVPGQTLKDWLNSYLSAPPLVACTIE